LGWVEIVGADHYHGEVGFEAELQEPNELANELLVVSGVDGREVVRDVEEVHSRGTEWYMEAVMAPVAGF